MATTCATEYLVWTGDEWEPEHRCRLDTDHDDMHECPDCGAYWRKEREQSLDSWMEVLASG